MEESTAYISAGRPGQVIKQALSLLLYAMTRLRVLRVLVSNLPAFLGVFASCVFPLSHHFVCSPALNIKCSAAHHSAANLLQMLMKTSEETFSLVMCQEKVSKEPLNISTTQQQGVKLALGYICSAQMSSVTEK